MDLEQVEAGVGEVDSKFRIIEPLLDDRRDRAAAVLPAGVAEGGGERTDIAAAGHRLGHRRLGEGAPIGLDVADQGRRGREAAVAGETQHVGLLVGGGVHRAVQQLHPGPAQRPARGGGVPAAIAVEAARLELGGEDVVAQEGAAGVGLASVDEQAVRLDVPAEGRLAGGVGDEPQQRAAGALRRPHQRRDVGVRRAAGDQQVGDVAARHGISGGRAGSCPADRTGSSPKAGFGSSLCGLVSPRGALGLSQRGLVSPQGRVATVSSPTTRVVSRSVDHWFSARKRKWVTISSDCGLVVVGPSSSGAEKTSPLGSLGSTTSSNRGAVVVGGCGGSSISGSENTSPCGSFSRNGRVSVRCEFLADLERLQHRLLAGGHGRPGRRAFLADHHRLRRARSVIVGPMEFDSTASILGVVLVPSSEVGLVVKAGFLADRQRRRSGGGRRPMRVRPFAGNLGGLLGRRLGGRLGCGGRQQLDHVAGRGRRPGPRPGGRHCRPTRFPPSPESAPAARSNRAGWRRNRGRGCRPRRASSRAGRAPDRSSRC